MNNPKDFKLPSPENASFANSPFFYHPNVDPAFILRYIGDDRIQPVIGSYLNYMAKVARLEADSAVARADFFQGLAKLHG